jgi:hypothetical protein
MRGSGEAYQTPAPALTTSPLARLRLGSGCFHSATTFTNEATEITEITEKNPARLGAPVKLRLKPTRRTRESMRGESSLAAAPRPR